LQFPRSARQRQCRNCFGRDISAERAPAGSNAAELERTEDALRRLIALVHPSRTVGAVAPVSMNQVNLAMPPLNKLPSRPITKRELPRVPDALAEKRNLPFGWAMM